MSGARRLVLSGAALTALLALVAVASHAHRPGGGSGGGTAHTPQLVFAYVASALFVLFPVAALIVIWVASLRRRQRLLEGAGQYRWREFRVLLLVCLIGLPAVFFGRHFVHYGSPRQQINSNPGIDAPSTERNGPRGSAQFQWLPALAVGSILVAGAAGSVALVIWKRRRGADWQHEADLTAALDEVLADTLDDLRAEKSPRRAVIRAYARMERTFAAHDVEREPHETSREYVDRALDRLGVSTAAVRRLTALYERAKFSSHAIDASMKDEAIDALAGLRAELEADGQVAA
jgi:hypothetical protein